jgi:hypothetical protein
MTTEVKAAESPGSMVSLAGPVRVIAEGAVAWPPQPVRNDARGMKPDTRRRVGTMRIARREARPRKAELR